jgi:long-chain acyl-CoA synthetase
VFRALQERMGLRRCRLPISGAAPISPDLLHWFHGVGIPIVEGFGMTECSGVSHVNLVEDNRVGSVGKALPIVECRLAEDGELLIRGPNVFVGYLHDDAATAEAIDSDGWLHTGDIGRLDDDDFLSIIGRKKEIIITAGGKNLSPEKIENALKMSPYIKEAVAIGDARKFISALIQIDFDAVGSLIGRQGITYTSFDDLVGKPEVRRLIWDAVKTVNDHHLARVEQVREFRLFPKELHQDDGELTATQKVRRRAITAAYGELIDSMYGAAA